MLKRTFVFVLGLLAPAFCALAEPAATTPAVDLTTVEQRLNDLAHPDPSVRDRARSALLTVDLNQIRQAVRESAPLLPSQVAALREIVTHLCLRNETYEKNSTAGFLGVRFQPLPINRAGGVAGRMMTVAAVIVSRYPGFCGYGALQDGDIVLEIGDKEAGRVAAGFEMPQITRRYPPGATIELQVLRRGAILIVPLVLDARPALADLPLADEHMQELMATRQQAAQRYWEANFAPLLRGQPS